MGQSNLLKSSGSKSSIPRTYDYHFNLLKNTRHNEASPAKYKLPALYDENVMKIDRIGIKYRPHCVFSTESETVKRYISPKHVATQLLTQSPPSTLYNPLKDKTFEMMDIQKRKSSVSTFSTS